MINVHLYISRALDTIYWPFTKGSARLFCWKLYLTSVPSEYMMRFFNLITSCCSNLHVPHHQMSNVSLPPKPNQWTNKYPYLQALPPNSSFKLLRLSCLSRTLDVSICPSFIILQREHLGHDWTWVDSVCQSVLDILLIPAWPFSCFLLLFF